MERIKPPSELDIDSVNLADVSERMKGTVGIVSDIEWPLRKGLFHTDSNYPKYSLDQRKTSAKNPTKHSRRYQGKEC